MAERNMVNLTITMTWEERKALKQVALDKNMTVSVFPREWLKEYQKRRQSSNGEELTDQELRNAVYAGSWTCDAKRYFSKTGCAADSLAGDYLRGSSIQQEYLETAIFWAASAKGKTVETHMAEHQNTPVRCRYGIISVLSSTGCRPFFRRNTKK